MRPLTQMTKPLTPAQRRLLEALAEHGNLTVGASPPIKALFDAGYVEWVQRPGSEVVCITDAGRAALVPQPHKEQR